MLSEGPLDQLDHAPTIPCYGGKLGIDATHKSPAEGAREWPEEISMSDEIRTKRRRTLGRVRHPAVTAALPVYSPSSRQVLRR